VSEHDHLDELAVAVGALTDFGGAPTLVGGMALVILGSQRVTKDFDFVIAHPGERVGQLVDRLYGLGFELVSRFDTNGEVRATIDNRRVAAVRLRLDRPASASFFNPASRLRLDLLFDFPIAARDLAERAVRRKIRSLVLHIACDEDLLQLKRLAHADRASARDAQDIAFLEARRSRP
jgi:hypothetical protein